MNRPATGFYVVGAVALALIPVLWLVSIAGLGTIANASKVADTVMVWLLSWGLVVVATLAALLIAGLCFSNAAEAMRRATADSHRPAA